MASLIQELPLMIRLQFAALLQAPIEIRQAIAFGNTACLPAAPFAQFMSIVPVTQRAAMIGLLLAPESIRNNLIQRLYAQSTSSTTPSPASTTSTASTDASNEIPHKSEAAHAAPAQTQAPTSSNSQAPHRGITAAMLHDALPSAWAAAARAGLGSLVVASPTSRAVRFQFVVQAVYSGANASIRSIQSNDSAMCEFSSSAVRSAVPRFVSALETAWCAFARNRLGSSAATSEPTSTATAEHSEPREPNENEPNELNDQEKDDEEPGEPSRAETAESAELSSLHVCEARLRSTDDSPDVLNLSMVAEIDGFSDDVAVQRVQLEFCKHLLEQLRRGVGCCVQVESTDDATCTILFAPDPSGCDLV